MTRLHRYHKTVTDIVLLLEKHGCSFRVFEHEEVRTSEEAARVRPEYSLNQGAKALIIRAKIKHVPKEAERQFVQIVVPGGAKFDPGKIRELLNAKDIRFATESEVLDITNGIKPGGVPPFGTLFNLPVYVDDTLLLNEEIIFNAGDRGCSVALRTDDYLRVVSPRIASFVQ